MLDMQIIATIKKWAGRVIAIYIVVITVVAVIAILLLSGKIKEVARLESNQQSLLDDIHAYRTENGLSAASVERLQLTVREYTSALNESDSVRVAQKRIIDELNLKVRRLQAISQSIAMMKIDTTTDYVSRDTLPAITSPKAPACSGLVEWSDPWVSISVRINENRAHVNIMSADTLYQVIHRVPRRFLFIRYGTKAVRQEVVSSNPHTKLVYTEYIEFTNRRGKKR